MDLRVLILLSFLCVQIRAESRTGSILFLDSPSHRFILSRSSDVAVESDSMVLSDVAAAVSVLLGFAPPPSLSADSSSKLNEVLLPNPFDRPRAVLMLEIKGIEDSQQLVDYLDNAQIGSVFRSKVLIDSSNADIQLPDENDVSVVSLDEPLGFDCDAACTDKELHDLASWMGGSYLSDAFETSNGELSVPLTTVSSLKLHMSKNADREFIMSLLSLIHNVRWAMEMHEDFSGSTHSPAELMTGCFTGIKALQEQYGPDGITQQGLELFFTTLSKLFKSLQTSYKGQIVGVFSFGGKYDPESSSLLNVNFTSQSSSRSLKEVAGSTNSTTTSEVQLVRWSLAWITGIIFLISTLLGVHFLLNMPLTRDTLLYSNVKLD
ncbi:PREDICTED: uncharacterized protein LOC104585816 [Nelumbo nucifera]|uniref:Uncharacterized protein LOC104585816 n=2 Tax=Nelumbo nucifera TaxID=4432 RepID=A0A1U7YTQ6_NELNU|nr:PREDICTED: uncharacterized protein LOC104585816 [Nelumbo nucifera]DAD23897.1 TPA_asm: hypothetical protein HUJ06_025360 [Nelumbo nucifera]